MFILLKLIAVVLREISDHYYNRCLQGVEGVARVAGGVATATPPATLATLTKIKPPYEFHLFQPPPTLATLILAILHLTTLLTLIPLYTLPTT